MADGEEQSEGGDLYVYYIPLKEEDGVEKACYSLPEGTERLSSRYTSTHNVVVVRDAVPHFHKDASAVRATKVSKEEYKQANDPFSELI